MKFFKNCLLLVIICFYGQLLMATHYRAGEILYELIGNLQYRVTIITYTKISYPSLQADRDSVIVDWGDGTTSVAPRINGPYCNIDGPYPCGVLVLTDVQKNEYQQTHQYKGLPPPPNDFYVLKFYDENRLGGILNMASGVTNGSLGISFYVEDTLFYPANVENIGFFSSPVLENPAVQYAFQCETFVTNPEAVDPDGDSLDYHLVACKQDQNDLVPQYLFPDQYCNQNGHNCVPNNTCTIDVHTGNFVWTEPCDIGFYNVGILIHKYRHGVCLGSMLRDFQIIVLPPNVDVPPKLVIPNDTCIRAGDVLIGYVTGTDSANPHDTLMLTAAGIPFQVGVSPAQLSPVAPSTQVQFFGVSSPDSVWRLTNSPVTGKFSWTTLCSEIQPQPYQVFFKVEDSYRAPGPDGSDPYHAQDIKTWQIHVIPPPVQNLTAVARHQSVVLNWQNPYLCDTTTNFRGFSVWRRVGCDPFVPSYCETGLAGTGYVKITTSNIFTYTYVDNTVVPGQAYSYRVLAEFYKLPPSGLITLQYDNQESVPSNEACVNAPVDLPVLLNVDVNKTDGSNGKIWIRWQKPLGDSLNLDTLHDAPPYRFDLYRNQGFNFSAPTGPPVMSWTFNSFSDIPDTSSFNDSGMDTKDYPWSYKIYFYADTPGATSFNDTVGQTPSASSVFLTIQPSDLVLYLHWNYNVPWSNDSFAIFKQNHITNIYDSIGMAYYTNAYADTGVLNDSTYCYYVKSFGHYNATNDTFPTPLLNKSEQVCAIPVDTVPPCPPTLMVTNSCDSNGLAPCTQTTFINHLLWVNNPDSCSFDISHYRIYYNENDSTGLTLLDSTTSRYDTTYSHLLNDNLAGCYAVTAVNRGGFASKFSNIVCVDNCPNYVLPNSFTPNGDNHNDKFTPFHPYCFITKIDMKIYNRWGELVFETNDPEINWNGKDKNGNDCSDGVYLYAGYYYEQRLGGEVRKPLSGQKKGGGFIHLIRK
jgi:gliding motility-associated-like protein